MTTTHRSHLRPKPVSAVANSFSKRPLAVFAVCLALLVPGIASAKKPAPSPDIGCQVLLSPSRNFVTFGKEFEAKIIADPSYPGHFVSPAMYVSVTFPMEPYSCDDQYMGPDGNCDWMVEKDAGVDSYYVTYMRFPFKELIGFHPENPKDPESPIVDPDGLGKGRGALDTNGTVDILGKVTEVLLRSRNGKKTEERDTWCFTANEPITIESP